VGGSDDEAADTNRCWQERLQPGGYSIEVWCRRLRSLTATMTLSGC